MKKVDIVSFKETLSKFTTGVTVICVKNKGIVYGKTVNSFNSLSLKPPLVLFSLGNYSSSIKTFTKSEFLSINILSRNQKNLSNHFSKKNPDPGKIEYLEGKYDTPYIRNCVGNLECKLIENIKRGDHIIFICKVINVISNNKFKPLSYYNSRYY